MEISNQPAFTKLKNILREKVVYYGIFINVKLVIVSLKSILVVYIVIIVRKTSLPKVYLIYLHQIF